MLTPCKRMQPPESNNLRLTSRWLWAHGLELLCLWGAEGRGGCTLVGLRCVVGGARVFSWHDADGLQRGEASHEAQCLLRCHAFHEEEDGHHLYMYGGRVEGVGGEGGRSPGKGSKAKPELG
jgi:hypothetical protein